MKNSALRMLTLLLLVCPAFALAQAQAITEQETSEERGLEQQLEDFHGEVAALWMLGGLIEQAPARDQQALVYRRDDRSFEVLRQADNLVSGIAGLPEGNPRRQALEQQLVAEFEDVGGAIESRLQELDQLIASRQAELEGLDGMSRVSAETWINSLMAIRFRYFAALVNHLESRNKLGLASEDLQGRVESFLFVQAESMAGWQRFFGVAKEDLQQRLSEDPDNTDLAAVLHQVEERHQRQMDQLDNLIELMERMGLDATAYKSLLVQGGEVSIELIEKGVMVQLAGEWVARWRGTLAEHAPDFLVRLFIFLLVLLVFRSLSRLVKRLVRSGCERSSLDMSQLLKDTLVSLSGGTVMLIGILMAISQLGISVGPMLAGLGIAGFIVGFALQDTLANFAAGAMILIYRPYDVDDFVEVTGAAGEVKKMNLVSTTITTFDNQTLVVPNSKIWGDVIKNVTAQKVRRVDLEFGIGYGDDIEHAERVLQMVTDEHELTLSSPAALIKVQSLGDSSVNLILRPWVKTEDYWTVYWDLMREVKLRFDQEGISIPFPQRDVHLYKDEDKG